MVDFLKYRWLYILISTVVIVSGMFAVFRWGYIYSIDFVGGTNLEYRVGKQLSAADVKKVLQKEDVSLIDLSIKKNVVQIRTKALSDSKQVVIKRDLDKLVGNPVQLLRSETVGPTLGKETQQKTYLASGLAILGILLYMSFAFKSVNFALAGVLAMAHDFLVLLGVYAILSHFLGAQFDTLFVTAILTTMSFSVHDTIVIFDKLREYRREHGLSNIEYYANKALTETLVRSLNNSVTIIFMLLALTLLGGTTIRFFVAALLIGTVTGTYSSPFVATPILVWLESRKKR